MDQLSTFRHFNWYDNVRV